MNDNKSAYNAGIYDEHIVNVLPYYREYHKQVIDVVENMGLEAPQWLDTGCGTGTLAAKALEVIPDACFTLCDPSENMLAQAKEKLQYKNIRFLNVPSDKLEFNNEHLCLSLLTICEQLFESIDRPNYIVYNP